MIRHLLAIAACASLLAAPAFAQVPVGGGPGLTTAAGVPAFLATPSSTNLATALTDETGSGATVFATSPTLVTPALGVFTATGASIARGTITTALPALNLTATFNNSGANYDLFTGTLAVTADQFGSNLLNMTCSCGGFLRASEFGDVFISGGFNATSGMNFGDVYIQRKAAATIRFGAADSAAPVAQTIGVQNVVAGTSNTAGAALIINGSQGTGTGAGGAIFLQTANATATGSTQNALGPALQLQANKTATFYGPVVMKGYTVSALPASPGTGAKAWVSDATACTFLGTPTGGGSTFCPVIYNGSAWVEGG